MGPSGESQLASLASGRSVDLDFERPLLSGEGKGTSAMHCRFQVAATCTLSS